VTAYKSRADWGARLRRGYVTFPVDRPIGVACHWPGTTTKFRGASAASIASALRGWQNFHMDIRGWSDIAYGVGIDWAGRVWQLRGVEVRTAANGSTESNRDYTAALWILGIGEQPTEAQIQAFRDWRSSRLLAVHSQAAAVKTHNDVRTSPTECPGSAVTALVRSGTLLRPGGTDTTEDWYQMATEADLRAVVRSELDGLAEKVAAAVLGARGSNTAPVAGWTVGHLLDMATRATLHNAGVLNKLAERGDLTEEEVGQALRDVLADEYEQPAEPDPPA